MVEIAPEMTWTTWEELLLTCAVKRHGQDWDSIAMELQNRSSHPLGLTAQICMDKYRDLKRRFMDEKTDDAGAAPIAEDGDTIPWLEELKKLRMVELKQEVHRRDLSIQSLQLKVKQLEEERERDSIANEIDDKKPDLENDKNNDRSGKSDGEGAPAVDLPEIIASKSASGDYSDRDSRTLNVSNSTENRENDEKPGGGSEPVPDRTDELKQDPESKPVAEDSCNDSSDTVAKHAASKPRQVNKKAENDSNELHNSAAESKERTSDVQSSASLTNKIRRKIEVSGAGSGGVNVKDVTPATIKRESAITEPLAEFFDVFRNHKHGSMFHSLLDIQKTEEYKNIIRQHVDLESIKTRIDDGSYSSCSTKFYSDLLLLFNNAVVFFPRDSDESAAALHFRILVLKEIKKKRIGRPPKSSPESAQAQPTKIYPDPEKPDSLLPKNKPPAPIIVCRKRSSISAKPGSSKKSDDKPAKLEQKTGSGSKQPVKSTSNSPKEEDSLVKLKAKEKPVTGVRSMRRNSKGVSNSISAAKVEAPAPAPVKKEKKKTEIAAPAKKSGAADFLKRIKRASPAKGSTEESGGVKKEQGKKKAEEKKEAAVAKKKGGGGKQTKEEISPSKKVTTGRPKRGGGEVIPAKRGRDEAEDDKGGGGSTLKRPKKKSRR